MAELLVRIVDKGPADDCSKAGDVIAVCPDGWPWSKLERTNPEWRIVRTSLLDVEVDALLFTAVPAEGQSFRRREWKFNFESLTQSADFVFSDGMSSPVVVEGEQPIEVAGEGTQLISLDEVADIPVIEVLRNDAIGAVTRKP